MVYIGDCIVELVGFWWVFVVGVVVDCIGQYVVLEFVWDVQ